MKEKPKDKKPEQKPRPEGVPSMKEFGKFVGRILNVPKSEIDRKDKRSDGKH